MRTFCELPSVELSRFELYRNDMAEEFIEESRSEPDRGKEGWMDG